MEKLSLARFRALSILCLANVFAAGVPSFTTVTAAPGAARVNVALAASGATALASSTHSSGYDVSGAINGDRTGASWGAGGGWNDGTAGALPDWLEVRFAGVKTIDEVAVFSVQDTYWAPSEPTATTPFTQYGLTAFQVQYWDGGQWLAVPGGAVSGNSLVWRRVTFAPLPTARVRIWITGALATWSRVAELEAYEVSGAVNTAPTVSLTSPSSGATVVAPATIALAATAGDSDGLVTQVAFYANDTWLQTDTTSPYTFSWTNVAAGSYTLTAIASDDLGATTTSTPATVTVTAAPGTARVNVARAASGATALASSTHSSGYDVSGAINGDRTGASWGAGGGWNDGTAGALPDWLEVRFAGVKTIDEVAVFSVQDTYWAPSEPTATTPFTQYGLTAFQVQYWDGGQWLAVPGGAVSGNSLVWRRVTFAPLPTARVRIWITGALATWSRVAELEAYEVSGAVNTAPTVSLTSPSSGATVVAPATIALAATAGDSDGLVTQVAFYANDTWLQTDTTSPYTFSWTNVAAGSYTLTAIASDDLGATTTSTPATVTVTAAPGTARVNVARAASGATALASSTHSSGYDVSGAINGDRTGASWGAGGGWNDGTAGALPDWLEVRFAGVKTIDEVAVFSVQDTYWAPSEPTATTPFTQYGLTAFQVQYWDGGQWLAVPGGAVSGNSLVWRRVTFAPLPTARVRIWITGALATWSRVAELEAYEVSGAPALLPPAVMPSTLNVRLDFAGHIPTNMNPTSPVTAGAQLILIDQAGYIYRWDGMTTHVLLSPSTAPAGVSLLGAEAVLNVAANAAGSRIYVVFTSSTVPDGVPALVSPRPGADAWQVLYEYEFNGSALSGAKPIVALQARSIGHTGGGLLAVGDGSLLLATGDHGDAGEDGSTYGQDTSSHLSKLLRIDPTNGAITIAARGLRNVQRLTIDSNGGDAHLVFADLGGWIAEEINATRMIDLLAPSSSDNFGWGRNPADGHAREGTFYINADGSAAAAAPTPEAGFVQPIAQFGREGAPFIAVSGPVTMSSFATIRLLFGDLVSGSVYATTASSSVSGHNVYKVNLFDSALQPLALQDLAGGQRPDPRFFTFPDGGAGVLLERTGNFYRLTEW